MLLSSLGLADFLQVSVMPFVQPPAFLNRNPKLVKLLKYVLQCLDRSLEDRAKRQVKLPLLGSQQLPGLRFQAVLVA